MGIKENSKKADEHIKEAGNHMKAASVNVADRVKDTLSEATHQAAAAGERQKREMLGEHLTLGEKTKSVLEETKHTIQANVDATKRRMDEK